MLAEAADGVHQFLQHGIVGFPQPQRDGNVALRQLVNGPPDADHGADKGMGVNGADYADEQQER